VFFLGGGSAQPHIYTHTGVSIDVTSSPQGKNGEREEERERMATTPKHRKLVVDTNAIVRGVHFERMAQELYTLPEVLAEVRDRQTRSSVVVTAVLPNVHVQEPGPEHTRRVTEFARKTGDISVLSDVDIKVIALTLALHEEAIAEPPPPSPPSTTTTATESAPPPPPPAAAAAEVPEDDGEGEWITPENLAQVQAKLRSGGADAVDDNAVKVGCLTADFAMQNVLIQMGLSVVSFDGLHIRRARTFALKCYSCFECVTTLPLPRFLFGVVAS